MGQEVRPKLEASSLCHRTKLGLVAITETRQFRTRDFAQRGWPQAIARFDEFSGDVDHPTHAVLLQQRVHPNPVVQVAVVESQQDRSVGDFGAVCQVIEQLLLRDRGELVFLQPAQTSLEDFWRSREVAHIAGQTVVAHAMEAHHGDALHGLPVSGSGRPCARLCLS